ncbi:MAG: DegQ protease [Rhodocyclaceae bacterium]|jgi:Do/DeqQ family serine protease|uniref:Do family serine endopeptidase n=1 Tax=Candidatus Desulfobacillus denitrificans TaxID=2608985 RepID=A0A809R245_9PROT|nr:Do family serine endopeptidase [Candidatus Desulfobacillus denitrificans]GIK45031.1 MAG: DegQ protease [Betaproteobacteria bacterium]GJQ56662.1 MAG: DegQ protease [Rhodocyclaceae bacterium]
MRRLWLIFAQTVTVSVAALFVVMTLKPDWLGGRPAPAVVALQEAAAPAAPDARKVVSYADAAKKALPSVVHIYTSKEVKTPRHPFADDPVFRYFFGDRFGGPQRQSGLGSGVIVSADGYILTNNHVVENMDEIEVATNDGRYYRARIVGTDPETDLAVLHVKAEGKLPAVTFAPTESLRVGDVVLAIGNPFGVGQTVTHGIVSALGRSQLGINTFENFIQTDAAVNPGNSGGALTDSSGNLVGINTAIYSRSGGSLGIGFAIPVSIARSVMEQIIKTGSVTRGWIGVEAQEITPELAESFKLPASEGAIIAGVMRGSPADRAGIRPGDVLMSISGKAVKDPQGMLELIAGLTPGSTAQFRLRRESKDLEVAVSIGKRPPMQRNNRE